MLGGPSYGLHKGVPGWNLLLPWTMPAISNYTRSMKRDIIRIYLDSIRIIFTTTSLIWSRLSSSSNLLQFLLINLRLNKTKKNPPSSKSCQKVISKIKRFQNIFSKKPLQSPQLGKNLPASMDRWRKRAIIRTISHPRSLPLSRRC